MKIEQLATLFNVSGISIVVLVSLFVLRAFPTPMFRMWTIAYALGLCTLVAEFAAPLTGRAPLYTLFECSLIALTCWTYVRTGRILLSRTLPRMSGVATVLAFTGVSAALLATGHAYMLAMAPELVGFSAVLIYLGVALIRTATKNSRSGTPWLGIPLILLGLLPFTYPLTARTGTAWLGFWASGLLNLLVGIGMVVFLLVETASELRLKNEELLKLDRLKSNFISTVSHELRTPLTAIKGATWILAQGLEGPLTDGQTNLVGMLSSQSDRLSRLITDVLDFSKLETGVMTYDLREGDLLAVVQSAVTDYAHIFDSKGIGVAVDLNSPGTVHFDGDRMIQVILNLVSNAAKFTPSGGMVTVRSLIKDGSMLISVTDTGIGIAPEFHEQVFSKFYQVEDHLRRTADGTGLGLSICKSIIEEGHGGRIWVESTPGEGSTFWISLPLATSATKVPSEATRV